MNKHYYIYYTTLNGFKIRKKLYFLENAIYFCKQINNLKNYKNIKLVEIDNIKNTSKILSKTLYT